MKTERLEEFVVLANVLSYSKAAEKMFISQPILSRHIRELEDEVGCRLFARNTHGVALTDEGKYFLKWARPLIGRIERAELALANAGPECEGTVRIICAEQCLCTSILAFVRSFSEGYPRIQLDILPHMASSHKEMAYSCDVFVTPCDFTDLLHDDIEGAFVASQQPLLAIPPYHHFGDLHDIRLEDLREERLIVPYADELFGPYSRNAMTAARKCRGALRKVEAESAQAGLLKVELGQGVMLIPHHLKHHVYPLTRTIPVLDADCVFPIYAYLNLSAGNAAARLLYDALRSELNESRGE